MSCLETEVPKLTEEQLNELLKIARDFIITNGPKGVLSNFDIEISLQPKFTEEEMSKRFLIGANEIKKEFLLSAGSSIRGGCYKNFPETEDCPPNKGWAVI